jgi:hypothetical protein
MLGVVGAAVVELTPDLGDCGDVDGVVDPAVPRNGGRLIFRPPEDTSTGAVPFQAANDRPRLGNRVTAPASPITMAAMTWPTPNRPVTEVRDARTTVASFLDSASWASKRRRSASSSAAS